MNVAIPEVDVGEDVIVVRDDNDLITRVQVKTAHTRALKKVGNFYAQFKLPLRQLKPGPPHLVYALAVRRNDFWEGFFLIRRNLLEILRRTYPLGSDDGEGNLILRLTLTPEDVTSKGVSFQPFRNCFTPWPPPDAG